ncbi:MAG: EamA family transporter RarD [Pseudomonadota bacterium]
MSTTATPNGSSSIAANAAREGLICAFGAYLLWGMMPVYFKLVGNVPALEVLGHRIFWAVPFGLLIIHGRKQWGDVLAVLRQPRILVLLTVSAAFIAGNWLVYIHAVQSGNIFQASLGYYINPLVSVLAGVVLFGERLNRAQQVSVGLAALGVLVLAGAGGGFPLISLALALSFTVYGVIRKSVPVGAMPGLFVETVVLVPIAGVYLANLMASGASAFSSQAPALMGILMLAGPVTVLPLMLFALAARRLPLATLGFIQFLAPTLQFLVGVVYGEALTLPLAICFACIWTAVLVFAADAWRRRPRAIDHA